MYTKRPSLECSYYWSWHTDDVFCRNSSPIRWFWQLLHALTNGSPDMAFPRMNNLSFWMYVAGTTLAICSVLSWRQRSIGVWCWLDIVSTAIRK